MVTAALGGPISRSTARQLWEVSRGNAFYLRELLIGTTNSGALSEAGGIWSLHEPLSTPDRLVELVASRLAGLPSATIAVIELLAIGEPFGMSMLEKLAGPDGLDEAKAQGFVHVSQDERRTEARLAHPIYGEAVRQSMPRSRLRRLSAMLAADIEAVGARRREDLLRLGRWQLDAEGRAIANARSYNFEAIAAEGEHACLVAGDMEGHATFLFMIGWVLIERARGGWGIADRGRGLHGGF